MPGVYLLENSRSWNYFVSVSVCLGESLIFDYYRTWPKKVQSFYSPGFSNSFRQESYGSFRLQRARDRTDASHSHLNVPCEAQYTPWRGVMNQPHWTWDLVNTGRASYPLRYELTTHVCPSGIKIMDGRRDLAPYSF